MGVADVDPLFVANGALMGGEYMPVVFRECVIPHIRGGVCKDFCKADTLNGGNGCNAG